MENYEVKETRVVVEGTTQNPWRIALITGAVGAVLIALTMYGTMIMAGDDFEKMEKGGPLKWVPYLITLGVVIWGILWHKRSWVSSIYPFGAGFKAGLRASLILALGVALYSYVSMHMLMRDTEKMNKIKESVAASIEEKIPNMSSEQLESAMKMMDLFFNPVVTALGGLLVYFLVGLVFSLIVGIFTQTRESEV